MAAELHELEYVNKQTDKLISFHEDPNNLANVSVNIAAELNENERKRVDEPILDKIKAKRLNFYETEIYNEVIKMEETNNKNILDKIYGHSNELNRSRLMWINNLIKNVQEEISFCDRNVFQKIDNRLETLESEITSYLNNLDL